jgi:serine/threonine protein kinase HipA of HipAB toxin-antitoxin module
MLDAGCSPETLRCDGTDGRKRILDPMMQFTQDKFLQLVSGFAFFCINAGLGQQDFCVDAGLL